MGAGANTLAATWQAALSVAGETLPAAETFAEAALATIYQDSAFVPSLTLDQIGPHLSDPAAAPITPQTHSPKPTASPGQIKRRRAATSPQR